MVLKIFFLNLEWGSAGVGTSHAGARCCYAVMFNWMGHLIDSEIIGKVS